MTEPAQGTPRAIREKPPSKQVRATDLVGNPPRKKAAKMREAVPNECNPDNHADQAANPRRAVAADTRKAVPVLGQIVLARERTGRSVCV